ncbi:MAG: hypothetical protein A3F43_05015 [Gammaproteobacteria bacterium RIFCSPHIGHO2_12_FULL_42_10]|nr:MAG: hypothetical protein A3F43_05015 [Gammaproteobacteria bacterium RIFCSPHIGHO2_12_FULL_42_10]
MKKLIISLTILAMLGGIGACTNQDMGTVGGAALGGVAGNALTHGSAVGTVAGAVGGGLIGHAVTN